jgi:Bacterial Ig domain
MIFKNLYLMARPQHGTIKLIEHGHFTYKPADAYKGPDSFTLRICGNEGGMDGCADLQYSVTVR